MHALGLVSAFTCMAPPAMGEDGSGADEVLPHMVVTGGHIPTVERVEALRDGASAIYGADAIGGVINFILRDDYHGAEASAQYTSHEHTGGHSKGLNAWAGLGDLATQKLNAYANVDYQKPGFIDLHNSFPPLRGRQ